MNINEQVRIPRVTLPKLCITKISLTRVFGVPDKVLVVVPTEEPYLLWEDGSPMLWEDGTKILLEKQNERIWQRKARK